MRALVAAAVLAAASACIYARPPPARGLVTYAVEPGFSPAEEGAIDAAFAAWTRQAPVCAIFERLDGPAYVTVRRASSPAGMATIGAGPGAVGAWNPATGVMMIYPDGVKDDPAWIRAVVAHEAGHVLDIGGRDREGRWTLHAWSGLMYPATSPDALDAGALRAEDVARARRECAHR